MRNNIIKAIFTITFFSVLTRAFSFGFKIFLSRKLGAVNIGIYQVALSVFFVLMTLTASGIPLVVSKLTAKYRVSGNLKAEHSVFTSALIINLISAAIICIGILIIKDWLAGQFAAYDSYVVLLLVLPCIVTSAVQMAVRGNLWGRQLFNDVCIIDLVETILRILTCLLMFALYTNQLYMAAISLSIANTLSTILSVIMYIRRKGKLASPKGHILPLIRTSTPITLVRTSSTVVSSLIAMVIPFILTLQGKTIAESLFFFGVCMGMAMPILYIPNTIIGSLAFVLVPTLTNSIEAGKKSQMRAQIEQAIVFAIVVSSLFIPAFIVMGKPISLFLYKNVEAGQFLSVAAWLLIPIGIESITSSMMNSLGLEIKSFVNYLIGAAIMFGIMLGCYQIFDMTIFAISLGSMLGISSVLDIIAIKRKTGISTKFLIPFGICILSLLPTYLFTQFLYTLLWYMPLLPRIMVVGISSVAFIVAILLIFNVIKISAFTNEKSSTKPKQATQTKKANA